MIWLFCPSTEVNLFQIGIATTTRYLYKYSSPSDTFLQLILLSKLPKVLQCGRVFVSCSRAISVVGLSIQKIVFGPSFQPEYCDWSLNPNSKHWFTTSFLWRTIAVFSYAIGSRKLSANEHFVLFIIFWCWSSSKFVTNNSDYSRLLFYNWPWCLRHLR